MEHGDERRVARPRGRSGRGAARPRITPASTASACACCEKLLLVRGVGEQLAGRIPIQVPRSRRAASAADARYCSASASSRAPSSSRAAHGRRAASCRSSRPMTRPARPAARRSATARAQSTKFHQGTLRERAVRLLIARRRTTARRARRAASASRTPDRPDTSSSRAACRSTTARSRVCTAAAGKARGCKWRPRRVREESSCSMALRIRRPSPVM